jgi:hypothetical protein
MTFCRYRRELLYWPLAVEFSALRRTVGIVSTLHQPAALERKPNSVK